MRELLIVLGLIGAAVLLLSKKKLGVILGGIFGVTLMLWICIQFYMFPFNFMSTAYFIFSKNEKYTGFVNLGEKPVYIERCELVSRFKERPENLEAVVEYAERTNEGFIFEPHSISVYERK